MATETSAPERDAILLRSSTIASATMGGIPVNESLTGLNVAGEHRHRPSGGEGQLLGDVRIGDRLWASQSIDFAIVSIRRQDFGDDVTDIATVAGADTPARSRA